LHICPKQKKISGLGVEFMGENNYENNSGSYFFDTVSDPGTSGSGRGVDHCQI
jgi:hypothetical protein